MSVDPRRRPQPEVPWLPLVILAIASALWVGLALYVARDPNRRRKVLRTAERTWVRVEDVADRGSQRFSRKRRAREERVRQIANELWDAVDDLRLAVRRIAVPPIARRPYAHGAYMGAAPALLDDPRWRRILAFLMPDVYRDVEDAVTRGVAVGALIPMFENNPVMAAFGEWRSPKTFARDELHGMEWDVFLQAELVDLWQVAPQTSSSTSRVETREEIVKRLVSSMVIAHASTTDTMQEQIGLCQWADVRRTRKTALGGVEPGAWLDLFGRALRLADAEDLGAAIREMQGLPRHDQGEECVRHTFVDHLPPTEVVRDYVRISGRPRLSVVLEVKSLRTTPALLVAMMEELNRRGLHVAAFGAFDAAGIRGVSTVRQRVMGEDLPGPREIVFLHFAGDLQLACDRGLLPPGTSAMFNGASLLVATPVGGGRGVTRRFEYSVDVGVVDELDDYRQQYRLELGLYVQENDCDAEAVALLSALVADHPDTFSLGFAWGGSPDEVAFEAGLGDHRGFGSQRVLGRFGVAATWKRRRPVPA